MFDSLPIRQRLAHAVTEIDRKMSAKPHYNPYALGILLGRVGEIADDIEAGAEPRAAIIAAFTGRELDQILRFVGLPVTTKEERDRGSFGYRPISAAMRAKQDAE